MLATVLLYLATAACVFLSANVILWYISGAVKGPKGHWLLGNMDIMLKGRMHDNFSAAVKIYGPLFLIRILQWKIHVVSDPEAITKVLKGGPSVAVKKNEAYFMFDAMTIPPCQSILTAADDDKYWKVVRAAVAQAFSTKNLKALFPAVVATTTEAYETAFSGGASPPASGAAPPPSTDLDALFLRITMDVLGHLTFGRGFGACGGGPCPELEAVERECVVLAERIKNPFRDWLFWKQEVQREKQWNKQYDATIRRMVEELKATPPPAHTLGAQLLAAKDPHTGGPLPELRQRAELALLVMAGFETTGHSAAVALYCIIADPAVEARVCEELAGLGLLATAGAPTPRPVQWEDLGKLRVLSAAVQESMRWMPIVASGTMRELRQDVELCGVVVRKGASVMVPLIAPHRDPRNWERPDEFDLDRWVGGSIGEDLDNTEGTKAPKGYVPFSEGSRNCVGQALARVELLVVLAQLLGRFHVELAPEMGGREGFEKSLDLKLTIRPMGGLLCRVLPRVGA